MKELIECVPNFSAGQNKAEVDAIVAAIANTRG
ncbi:MAG: glutamate formiminotransferase, partial [Candidatus Marinimicrobia bacterium]|nr:glutamate formiminotransferase [Candidatus Neomarinimicrobiota bacterium]